MQETVQFQIRYYGNNFKEGDVILCNHPAAGGSHLPDLTVITPVIMTYNRSLLIIDYKRFFILVKIILCSLWLIEVTMLILEGLPQVGVVCDNYM